MSTNNLHLICEIPAYLCRLAEVYAVQHDVSPSTAMRRALGGVSGGVYHRLKHQGADITCYRAAQALQWFEQELGDDWPADIPLVIVPEKRLPRKEQKYVADRAA